MELHVRIMVLQASLLIVGVCNCVIVSAQQDAQQEGFFLGSGLTLADSLLKVHYPQCSVNCSFWPLVWRILKISLVQILS